MPPKKEWIGKHIDKLTVVKELEPYRSPTGKSTRRFLCRCDCGAETVQLQSTLSDKRRYHQCPECSGRDRTARELKTDLTGQHFDRLEVLEPAPLPRKQANGQRTGWRCRCECGNEIITTRKALVGGKRSCGCLIGESSLSRIEQDNVLGRYGGTVISAIQPDRLANSNSNSGIKGVYWSNGEQCWIAKITVQRKTITIGRFHSLEAATKSRREAEEKYFAPIISSFKEAHLMNPKTFNILFSEALSQPNSDIFVSEWATSSLFDPSPDGPAPDYNKITEQLKQIHRLAHISLPELRAISGLTQAAFAERFCIPRRTVEGWEAKGTCPSYVRLMLAQLLGITKRP